MMPRSNTFLHWLRHAGVPVARPGVLLVALAALLLTTLAYLGIMLTDDTLLLVAEKHMPELTSTGQTLMRQGAIQQGLFLVSLLLGGQFCLVKGLRFSRRIWLLILCFVALADLARVMLPAVTLIVNLVLGTLSEVPAAQWAPLVKDLIIGACFLSASALLFLPPVGRWRMALRQLTGKTT